MLLANALVHQNLSVNAAVRVSMFHDHIEITSAGGLPDGISKEDYLGGELSLPRNPIIANVFHYLGIIEKFGTGIHRIMSEYQDFQDEPESVVSTNFVKVVLPKLNYRENTIKSHHLREGRELNYYQMEILRIIKVDPTITQRKLAAALSISPTTLKKRLNEVVAEGIIGKQGTTQNMYYDILIGDVYLD